MIYLAIPYTGIEELSFQVSTAIAAELTKRGEIVFAPITHSHPMAIADNLPGDWEFWERVDRAFLGACEEMRVICLDGWRESVGVKAEIGIAEEYGIPVTFIDKGEIGDNMSTSNYIDLFLKMGKKCNIFDD